jgi:hypothetical protein
MNQTIAGLIAMSAVKAIPFHTSMGYFVEIQQSEKDEVLLRNRTSEITAVFA